MLDGACFLSGILGGSDSNVMDDDQILLDPNSNIGMFIRRCLLAFNQMSFEVIIQNIVMAPFEHADRHGIIDNAPGA